MNEIDLHHLGTPGAICCFADLQAGVLVDPGPDSAHERLLAALPDDWAPRRILLTHIHFDHAGATGRLIARWPSAEVCVHERGAAHLVDPVRLVASAKRIYRRDFGRLWGAVVPVPEKNIRVLHGGEAFDGWRVAYTPGHARHHVGYLREADGSVMAGDVAGVRIANGPVLPPSPPPDIDRERWLASVALIADWKPTSLRVTHFGSHGDVDAHLDELCQALGEWSELARASDAARFAEAVRARVAERTSDLATRASYERGNPPETLWGGWARYWTEREDKGKTR
ncbi:MAG: hypothetical protein V7607_2949 [Solirubrobacteraceae bacterium]